MAGRGVIYIYLRARGKRGVCIIMPRNNSPGAMEVDAQRLQFKRVCVCRFPSRPAVGVLFFSIARDRAKLNMGAIIATRVVILLSSCANRCSESRSAIYISHLEWSLKMKFISFSWLRVQYCEAAESLPGRTAFCLSDRKCIGFLFWC
jgi:hypothetical protein